MEIDGAIGAQAGISVLLDNLAARSTEVSEFLESAVGLEEIYGSESDKVIALMNASNLGTTIDFTIGRLRSLLEQRTKYLTAAWRAND